MVGTRREAKKWQTAVLRFSKEKLGNLVVQEAYPFGEVEGQISLLHYELYLFLKSLICN